MEQREVEGGIDLSSFRLAGTPSPIVHGSYGATVPVIHGTQIGHHAIPPSESMRNEAVRDITEECCERVLSRGVGRGRDDTRVVNQSTARAVGRTVAVRSPESSEIDELVTMVMGRMFLPRSIVGAVALRGLHGRKEHDDGELGDQSFSVHSNPPYLV